MALPAPNPRPDAEASHSHGPPLWRARVLSEAGIAHGFTTRLGGASTGRFASLNLGASWGDDPTRVAENLRRVAAAGGFSPESLCQVVQVHGDRVVILDRPERRLQEADGMATDRPLVLGVLSADCVGLLLGDGKGRVAAAHAGWRGTVAGIAGQAVAALRSMGAPLGEVRAALTPSIGPCCFEVGEEVAAAFARVVPSAVLRSDGARPHVDLWRANRELLLAAGLRPEHVGENPPCTRCDATRFFSYRRDGAGIGQHLSFIIGSQGGPE